MKNTDSEKLMEYVCRAHLELVENRSCYIEGLKRIEEYTNGKIKINLGKLSVSFFGDGLFINAFSGDGAVVEGVILRMEFGENA